MPIVRRPRGRAVTHALVMALGSGLLASAATLASAQIIAADAKWEELPKGGRIFAEGVVAAKDGKVYITDITAVPNPDENPGGTIYRYDPATGQIAKHLEPSGLANGLHVGKDGALLIAQFSGPKGLRRVSRQNLTTGEVKVIAETYQGKKLSGPNDVTTDAQGRIYFTDALYTAQDEMELPNSVYRLDTDGTLTRIVGDILRPNGIEVSPDGKKLFVGACNATALRKNPHGPEMDAYGITEGGIVAYDLDNGKIAGGKLIFTTDVCVDGMTMDADGHLYVAQHNGNRQAPKTRVTVIDATGTTVQEIPLPAGANLVTNLGFGRGADAGNLYISAAAPWAFYRIRTTRKGHYFE